MAAQKQPLFISLAAGGLKTGIAPQLLTIGAGSLGLENMHWDVQGALTKRSSFVAMPTGALPSGATLLSPWQYAMYKDSLISLSLYGGNPLYQYSPAQAKWNGAFNTATGTLDGVITAQRGPLSFSSIPVVLDDNNNQVADVAADSSYVYTATGDEGNDIVTITVRDAISHAIIVRTFIPNAYQCRIIACGAFVVVVAVNSSTGAILSRTITRANVTGAITSNTMLSSGVDVAAPLSLTTDGTLVYAATATTALETFLATLNPATNAVTALEIKTASGASIISATLGWLQDFGASGKLGLITVDTAGVQVQWNINAATGVAGNTYAMNAAVTTGTSAVGWTTSNSSVGEFVLLTDVTNNATGTIWQATKVGSTIASALWCDQMQLRSNVFQLGADVLAWCTNPESESVSGLIVYEQSSHYCMRVAPTINQPITAPLAIANRWSAAAGIWTNTTGITSVVTDVSGASIAALTVQSRNISLALGEINVGVRLVYLNGNQELGKPVEFADSLFVPGAVLQQFDGTYYGESDPSAYPILSLAQTTGGSLTSLATYGYMACYRWTDANGRIKRGTMSNPQFITLTGSNDAVTVTSRYLELITRVNGATAAAIEVYRTLANVSSEYQLQGTYTNLMGTTSTFSFADGTPDSSLALNEPAYTTGGILDAEMPGGLSSLAVYDLRLWGLSMDDPTKLWFTKQIADGVGIQFNEALTLAVGDYGNVTAIARMVDDRLIVFYADAIQQVTGTGPDNLGNNSQYLVSTLATGVGTVNPQSIVSTPNGLMFRSSSTRVGMKLLTRSNSVDDVGLDVHELDGIPIVSSYFAPELGHARFHMAGGTTLVYDVVNGQWSTYTGQAASASCWWSAAPSGAGAVYWNTAHGAPLIETAGTYCQDAGVTSAAVVTTPWLSLAGLRGYERFYRAQGVGTFNAAHTLNLSLYGDFDDVTPLVTPSVALAADWNWVLKYSRALGSVKLSIAETSSGAGASIVGVTFLVAAKANLRPLPASANAS